MNAKAFGIIALVVAILSIFIPLVGIYLPILVAILAIFSAGEGYTLGASAIGINLVNIIFLSPLLWIVSGMGEQLDKQTMIQAGMSPEVASSMAGLGIFMICIQIAAGVALFIKNKRKKALQFASNS